jgi:class 3 adenylate cyclase
VVLSGRMGIRTDDGEELVVGPNQVFDLPPGHVTWVEGEDELVMVDWAGGAGFDPQPGEEARAMATILFTDIVSSTARASEAGDAVWKRTAAMHDDVVRGVLPEFGGREIETAGDSFLVAFANVESAIRCGLALIRALGAIQLPIRVGIHSGEVVMSRDDVRGLAVHTAARILDQARAREVLVSSTTRDLAEGTTELTFESRGRFRLKGLSRELELFSVAAAPPAATGSGSAA